MGRVGLIAGLVDCLFGSLDGWLFGCLDVRLTVVWRRCGVSCDGGGGGGGRGGRRGAAETYRGGEYMSGSWYHHVHSVITVCKVNVLIQVYDGWSRDCTPLDCIHRKWRIRKNKTIKLTQRPLQECIYAVSTRIAMKNNNNRMNLHGHLCTSF